jgi:hypothetical protein
MKSTCYKILILISFFIYASCGKNNSFEIDSELKNPENVSAVNGDSNSSPVEAIENPPSLISPMPEKQPDQQPITSPPISPPIAENPNTEFPPEEPNTEAPALPTYESLNWEITSTSKKVWSEYLHSLIDNELLIDFDTAQDIERFCPKYQSLSRDQRVNVWGALIAGISKFESGHNPLSRMTETTMGIDPITKKQVVSEGLLQLSYQDTLIYPFCQFDWKRDKGLATSDSRKTILDPYRNLNCGARILAQQIRRRSQVVLSSNVYWAVIKEGGKYQKINAIASIVKKLSFCSL